MISPVNNALDEQTSRNGTRLSDFVFDSLARARTHSKYCLGVLEGEGVGPEMIRSALDVLDALESITGHSFQRVRGGRIGTEAEKTLGTPLPEDVAAFCENIFSSGAPILAGPGGGRFVYDLRKRFDLFCKFVPLRPAAALAKATRLRSGHIENLDILIVRDNVGGVYQGRWSSARHSTGLAHAEHTFSYQEDDVRRIVLTAARAAADRRGELTTIIKDGGLPSLSELWRNCTRDIAEATGVKVTFVNIDLAAYQLIQEPRRFDVIVCPNLFGDILADLGAVLLGSRGLSFSGNFSSCGRAVYQTNHGSGYDLVGGGTANPVAQIHALAMLLRESFGLAREASLIEQAVETVWRAGWRTFDLPEAGCRTVGTREFTDRVIEALLTLDPGSAR